MSKRASDPVKHIDGRYNLTREIGRGGMATVYLADDLKHGRQVAIKVLDRDVSAALAHDRFLREIEIAARLNHPHIVPLFDSGSHDEFLYYVMPYIEGESLRHRLERDKQLPLEEALRLTREIASAIGHAHQNGIVHRDIKPENVLLSHGIAVVADFGIGRAMSAAASSPALTQFGLMLGTPQYVSPEQALGEDVDGRSDIYSLGCVLFEMLAGRPPFVAPRTEQLIAQHITQDAPLLSDIVSAVPSSVAATVAVALAKQPEERHATAAQFAEALAAASSARTISQPGRAGARTVPNNLPVERTRFIGRSKETAEIGARIREARLVTLTGIGGCGKTRLALSVARSILSEFPDGVWFVDLAPLTETRHVMDAVAATLGVPQTPDEEIVQSLREHVRDGRMLILLDNCEHVISTCAELADQLLSAGPELRMLATSREGLGVDGETVVSVRSMSVPPQTSFEQLDSIGEAESVRLFVDRAQMAVSDFGLTGENAHAVAEICRRLDGIPLAIELAAARTRLLSPAEISAKLDDRFRLLASGSRAVLPRHQTLRATIQWSYDQLADEEKHLLRLLSVFAGGWTLRSATRVANDGADEFRILETIARLVDKSLAFVQHAEAAPASETRYGMLETVRQYARERLAEAGEVGEARARHLSAFAEIAENAYRERMSQEDRWTRTLEMEHDNLRAALDFARDTDAERYVELAGALAWFWQARSYIIEGREHVTRALAASSPNLSGARARALWGLGIMTAWKGDPKEARRYMEDALAMWRSLDDRQEIANALEGIGWAHFLAGEDELAEDTFEECLRIQREGGDPVLINRAMVALAQVKVALSKVDEARPMSREVIAFANPRGDKRSEHFGWHFLADCALIEGSCSESLPLYQRSLQLAEEIGDRLEISFEVQGTGMSLAGLGNGAQALRLISAGKAEWRRIGVDPYVRFWDELLQRYIAIARASLGDAAADRAWKEGSRVPFESAISEARSVESASESTRRTFRNPSRQAQGPHA